MKHYEDVWNEAERISFDHVTRFKRDKIWSDSISELVIQLNADNSKEKQSEIMGEILISLSYLSSIYDINTWKSLRDALNNYKIDLMD